MFSIAHILCPEHTAEMYSLNFFKPLHSLSRCFNIFNRHLAFCSMDSCIDQGCKAYRAEARLGCETNTQDAEGEETVKGEWEHVTKEAVNDALGQFTGHIMQVRRESP